MGTSLRSFYQVWEVCARHIPVTIHRYMYVLTLEMKESNVPTAGLCNCKYVHVHEE